MDDKSSLNPSISDEPANVSREISRGIVQAVRNEPEIDWIDQLSVDQLKETLRRERTNSDGLATTLIRVIDQKDAVCRILWQIVKEGHCTSIVYGEASITLLLEIATVSLLKEIKEYRCARAMDISTPR
jgi:hypothetical protein